MLTKKELRDNYEAFLRKISENASDELISFGTLSYAAGYNAAIDEVIEILTSEKDMFVALQNLTRNITHYANSKLQ